MQKVYQDDSYCREIETTINGAWVFEGKTELACEDLLYHPAGGGQPDDHGSVVVQGKNYKVASLRKHKGEIRIVLDDGGVLASETGFGDVIICSLDWERRNYLMRLHSAAHVLMAAAHKSVKGYVPGGMQIAADLGTATIRFQHEQEPDTSQIEQILQMAKDITQTGQEIISIKFQNLDAARNTGKDIFRMDPAVQLKGQVRIVKIGEVDFNPCSGTHVKNTIEIGNIKLIGNHSVEQAYSEIQYSITPTCAA
jgi:Ser-tRNA(Ala) deacylase AlaX